MHRFNEKSWNKSLKSRGRVGKIKNRFVKPNEIKCWIVRYFIRVTVQWIKWNQGGTIENFFRVGLLRLLLDRVKSEIARTKGFLQSCKYSLRMFLRVGFRIDGLIQGLIYTTDHMKTQFRLWLPTKICWSKQANPPLVTTVTFAPHGV